MSHSNFVSFLLHQTTPSTRFIFSSTSHPLFALSFFWIWNLLWDTTTISISALSLISRIVFRAFATVLTLVLALILSTLLVSVFWYIPWCCDWLFSLKSIGRFRCDGEGDFWRNVRGLMCFRFLGIYFWWKIGGYLCAAMLTCVVVVYPLLCGHYGTVSVPFAEDGGFVLYFGLIL